MVKPIECPHGTGQGQYEHSRSYQVHPGGGLHFKFRRWKISTAPEMAIAEYSNAYRLL